MRLATPLTPLVITFSHASRSVNLSFGGAETLAGGSLAVFS
jgi:hypothetical protein